MSIQPLEETSLTGEGKLKNVTAVTTMCLVLKVFYILALLQNDIESVGSRLLTRLGLTFTKNM